MDIAVVDDEEVIRHQIHGLIKKQDPAFHVSDFAAGEELLMAGREFENQIPPVASVKTAPKLSFQFIHRGI